MWLLKKRENPMPIKHGEKQTKESAECCIFVIPTENMKIAVGLQDSTRLEIRQL